MPLRSHHTAVCTLLALALTLGWRHPPTQTPPRRAALTQRARASPASITDLNHATLDELISLPGIGGVVAVRIIEARPFRAVDELTRVRGIGARRLLRLRPWITVR